MGLLLFMTDLPDIPARCKCRGQNPPADKCCNNIVSDNRISPLYLRSVVAEKRRECNKGERFVYLQTTGRRSESSTRLLRDQLALFFRGRPPKSQYYYSVHVQYYLCVFCYVCMPLFIMWPDDKCFMVLARLAHLARLLDSS